MRGANCNLSSHFALLFLLAVYGTNAHVVYSNDEGQGDALADGWSNSHVRLRTDGKGTCRPGNCYHGPFHPHANGLNKATTISKIYPNLPKHSKIRISLRYFAVDTWNSGEKAFVKIDGIEKWSRLRNNWRNCGSWGTLNDLWSPVGHRCYVNIEKMIDHSDASATITIGVNRMDNYRGKNIDDEYWAFDSFKIEVICEAPLCVASTSPPPPLTKCGPKIFWSSWKTDIQTKAAVDDSGAHRVTLKFYKSKGTDVTNIDYELNSLRNSNVQGASFRWINPIKGDYPFIGKTTHGQDDLGGERDLAFHPPQSSEYVVLQFIVSHRGFYSMDHVGCRRLDRSLDGDDTDLLIYKHSRGKNVQKVAEIKNARYSAKLDSVQNLGILDAGDSIYIAKHHSSVYWLDSVRVRFRIIMETECTHSPSIVPTGPTSSPSFSPSLPPWDCSDEYKVLDEGTGAKKDGWSPSQASVTRRDDNKDCMDFSNCYHGPFTSGSCSGIQHCYETNTVSRLFKNLPAHDGATVELRYFAVDSWDDDDVAYLKVDDNIIWDKVRNGARSCQGWKTFSEALWNPWDGDESGHKCYESVTENIKHNTSELEVIVGFESDKQDVTNEYWAFDSFKLTLGCTSSQPTSVPSTSPTLQPSISPSTDFPSVYPTSLPSLSPTTSSPTVPPTASPSGPPSSSPTLLPSSSPSTSYPTRLPTISSSLFPSSMPTAVPSHFPTTPFPTTSPTLSPSISPSYAPTNFPSNSPTTARPTISPTLEKSPYISPSKSPPSPQSSSSSSSTSDTPVYVGVISGSLVTIVALILIYRFKTRLVQEPKPREEVRAMHVGNPLHKAPQSSQIYKFKTRPGQELKLREEVRAMSVVSPLHKTAQDAELSQISGRKASYSIENESPYYTEVTDLQKRQKRNMMSDTEKAKLSQISGRKTSYSIEKESPYYTEVTDLQKRQKRNMMSDTEKAKVLKNKHTDANNYLISDHKLPQYQIGALHSQKEPQYQIGALHSQKDNSTTPIVHEENVYMEPVSWNPNHDSANASHYNVIAPLRNKYPKGLIEPDKIKEKMEKMLEEEEIAILMVLRKDLVNSLVNKVKMSFQIL